MDKKWWAIIGLGLNLIVLMLILFKIGYILEIGIYALILSLLALGCSIVVFFKDLKFFKIMAVVMPILLILFEIFLRIFTKVTVSY